MEIVSLNDVHLLFARQLYRAGGRKEDDEFDELLVKEAFRAALKYIHRPDSPIAITAAYYAIEILRRQPFSRLNIPMARAIAVEFLTKNGWKLHTSGLTLFETFINGRIHDEAIVEWFIRNARPRESTKEGRFFTPEELIAEAGGFVTVADLEPGMEVRIPKHRNRIAIITSIEPFGTIGKARAVHYKWKDAPSFVGWHLMDPSLSYDWQIVGPVEREDVHTDTGPYEESTGLKEATVYVPDEAETIDLKTVPEEEIKAAYDEWVRKHGAGFGYRPNHYAIFGRMLNEGVESFASIVISTAVEIEITFEAYNRMIRTSVDCYETPVDGNPLRIALLDDADKAGVLYREVIATVNKVTGEMWADFIGLFRPVAREEVYGDISGYEESITREEFDSLKPGDRFYFNHSEYAVVERRPDSKHYFLAAFVDGNPELSTKSPWGRTFWRSERGEIDLKPVEREDVHADIGPYEESRSPISEIRGKTLYRAPKSGTGLPSLSATRSENDEVHREDFNSIYYEVKPWQIKVGRASLSNVVVVFKVKCFPNGTSENPYEDESAVRPLDGPPFYALTVALSVMPGRGQSIPFHVKRYFDASGTLAWAKAGGTAGFRDIFCPMADLRAIENRFFGDFVPGQDGYFLALVGGSVRDLIGTAEVKMNLWNLFNPFVKELARRPEVVELEKPFATVEREDVHTDVGYEEGLRRELKRLAG
jgi:prophage maintenance system killer protein